MAYNWRRNALYEDTWNQRGRGSVGLTTCWRVHHLKGGPLSPRRIMLGGRLILGVG